MLKILQSLQNNELLSITQNEITNDFGNKFHLFIVNDEVCPFNCYQCSICHKYFTSKSSVTKHHHTAETWKYDEVKAADALMDFVCVCNISINAITSEVFEQFVHSINPYFQISKKTAFRERLQEYSERIHTKNLVSLQGKNVYLLIDGVRKFTRAFEALIVVTHDSIFFWHLKEMPHATGLNIATFVTDVVSFLTHSIGCRVISITSDNASNNINAFGDFLENGSSSFDNVHFIRFACLCHTIELGIHDFLKAGEGLIYYDALLILLDYIKTKKHDSYPNMTIRWDSIYDCCDYVQKNWNNLILFINQDKEKHKKSVQDPINAFRIFGSKITFDVFFTCMKASWDLIKHFEGDHSTISSVWFYIVEYYGILSKYFEDYDFTKKLWIKIIRQISFKNDLLITLLAFSFTKQGHDLIACSITKREMLNYMIGTLDIYLRRTNQTTLVNDLKTIHKLYISYIENPFDEYERWETLEPSNPLYGLGQIATQLLEIPCSEAAVERLFAHLNNFFNSHSKQTNEDLLNSRLTIKMNYIFKHAEKPEYLSINEVIHHYTLKSTYKNLLQ